MRALLDALPPLAGALALLLLAALMGFGLLPDWIRSRRARLAVPAALSAGLLVLGWTAWTAGTLAGTRSIPVVWGVLAVIALRRARALGSALRRWLREIGLLLRASPFSATLLLAGVLTSLPQVLLPVCDSDGLRYHMALPKYFLLQGRVSLYPWDLHAHLPLLSEMLYMAGIATTGGETAKVLHYLVFLLALAVLVTFVHRDRRTRRVAAVAPLLLLVSPVAAAPAVATYNDHFGLLPLAAAASLIARGSSPVAIGLCLGSALAAKHPSAPAVFALACVCLFTMRHRLWRTAATLLGIGALSIAPWAIQNVLTTGDPFYPVGHVLLGIPVPGALQEGVQRAAMRFRVIDTGPLALAWSGSTPGAAPDDIVGWHFLAALLLLPVPALVAARARRLASGDFLVLLALVLSGVGVRLFFQPPARFSLAMFWALAALLSLAGERLAGRWSVPLLAALVVPAWLSLGSYLLRQFEPFAYLSGAVGREAFLSRYVPGYRAARSLASQPAGVVMAVDFPAPYYLDKPWIAEGYLHDPPIRAWIAECASAEELLSRLREKGVRYVLITPGYGGGTPITMLPLAPGPAKVALVAELRSRLRLLGTFDGVDVFAVPAS